MFAVMASAGLAGLTFGYTLPLLALIMEKDGIGSTLIGLSAAVQSAAILAMGPLLPRLFIALGLRRTMALAIAVGTLAIGALGLFEPLYGWFPLRLVLGAAVFVQLIASDVWITQGAGPRRRGRMIAIYGTMITGGLAAGPLLVPLTGTDGALPFVVCTALFASSAVPLLLAYGPVPAMEGGGRLGVLALLAATPVLIVAVLAFGVVDASVLSLLPVYGLHSGMSEAQAVLLITILVAGSIILQLPVGWFADRVQKYHVLLACAALGALAAALLPLLIGIRWALWPCLFVLGGANVGMYIVSLAILGDRYAGRELAVAVSIFAMILSLGATAGPIAAGGAMRLWDPYGFNVVICAAFVLALIALCGLIVGRRGRSAQT